MCNLKKAVLFFVFFAALFFAIDTYAQAVEKKIKVSFVLRVESATFTHTKELLYQLAIPYQSVHSVLAFADRPVRKAFLWSPSTYSKFTQSNNETSFNHAPPNLVLSFYPKPFDGVFEVVSAERKKDAVILTLRYIEAKLPDNKIGKQIASVPENYQGAMLMFVDDTSLKACVAQMLIGQAADGGVIDILLTVFLAPYDAILCATEGD